MFTHARGEMFDWLRRSEREMSDCGLGSPIQHLERCGLLRKNLLAVHVNYLGREDAALLATVPGIGKKVAGRIILDLKDRLGFGAEETATGPLAEVRDALLALGLTPQEARDALATLGLDGERPVEDLLREALRSVGR